jgi:hypothetical protein
MNNVLSLLQSQKSSKFQTWINIGIKIKSVSVCESEAQNCPSELNFCRPKLSTCAEFLCFIVRVIAQNSKPITSSQSQVQKHPQSHYKNCHT